jgi:uncharacterized protein GlcG (DUF336 family)
MVSLTIRHFAISPFAIRPLEWPVQLMCPGKPAWGGERMRALSLDQVNTIIAATFAAAKKERCRPMSAIVLDAGGRVKAFQKQDGASMLRFEVCYGKAYASLALGRPSKLVLQKANEKPLFMQSIDNLADYPLFLEGGGQLIRDAEGEVMGAIGVTGDANEMDDICAIAGIHAVGLRADSDFFHDPEQMRALSIHKSAPLKDPRKPARSGGKTARATAAGRNGARNRSGPQAAKSGP